MIIRAMRLGAVCIALALAGCATTARNPVDPLEGFNRAMFSFNDAVDKAALKPAATVYRAVLPSFMQTGIGNFFGNIGDVWSSVNNMLQGKVGDGLNDFMRVAVNTTFGIGGLLDIGSEAGLPKHKEDFGQTLGKWGVDAGPYLVLPLAGSSTFRDAAALPIDYKGDLWNYTYPPVRARAVGALIHGIDQRAAVLDASDLIEEAAIDRYEFVRDAFLQRRESKVYDGDPPRRKPQPKEDTGMHDLPSGQTDQAVLALEPELKLPIIFEQIIEDDKQEVPLLLKAEMILAGNAKQVCEVAVSADWSSKQLISSVK
jgi:phospholipid-binding lipoprotein MlaA